MTEGKQAPDGSLEIHLLGLVDFDAALALQERLVFDLSGRTDHTGALLICEHPPIVTLGSDASSADLLREPAELARDGIDTRWLGRGGGACCHAPGQLALYCLLPIDRMGMTLSTFRNNLEEACIAACRDVHVPARRLSSTPGVWGRAGQLAVTGIAYKNGVTSHGLFLNVATDPSFLAVCRSSPADDPSTSMQAQLLQRIPMNRVREALLRHVQTLFGYTESHIYTGHPLLRRTSRKVCLHV